MCTSVPPPRHFDFMLASAGRQGHVQFFAFLLNQVRPRGDGTLVFTGSRRLLAPYLSRREAIRTPQARASFEVHP
jgi:hypothetical protein